MAALRLSRAVTRRAKIVIFEGAYHGHSDLTLASPRWKNNSLTSAPMTPGTCQKTIDDVYVLKYGSDQALEFIEKHGSELAAVVVEAVQGRRPNLQPRELPHRLRALTSAQGSLLVCVELITGFRVHPGGAQAWFDVKADIAAYGKLIGGGLPIGALAGQSRFMDGIDGGMWQYGDDSYPMAERIYFGGTFCQHPLTMATSLASMRYLKEQSPHI